MAGVSQRAIPSTSLSPASVLTDSIDASHLTGVSVMLSKTGTGTGTAKLQWSNDGANWIDIPTAQYPLASATVAATDPVSVLLHVDRIQASLIRVVYTNSTAPVVMSGKWFGKPY